MRRLTMDEQHALVLVIAKKFKEIAERHGIPYYMLGGSQLGAVRHKGFIPWDDDMDFGVPREHFDNMLALLEKEMGEDMEIKSYENSYLVHEMRKMGLKGTKIDCSSIFLNDWRKDEKINIDIFPLDYGPAPIFSHISPIKGRIHPSVWYRYGVQYLKIAFNRLNYKEASMRKYFFLRYFHPISKNTMIRWIRNYFKKFNDSNSEYIHNVYGMWCRKEIVHKAIIGKPTLYQFEDTEFYGVEKSDEYLRHLYNDYMQIPPEDKRHTHGEGYYADEELLEKYLKK